jgi:SWI/SNF-related matrix-associated actin-dependent regulator of chromatin subfamily A3
VHRLGQTRETTVWRLIMEGSVEERVLDIQKEKRQLVKQAFQGQEGARAKAKESRMGDVLKLLS